MNILLIMCALLALFSDKPEIDPARYFIPVETQEEAEAIAEKVNGELLSYSDGVATYIINRPLKRALRSMGIDTYTAEESVTIDGEDFTLSRDQVYYLDDFETGCNPELNEKFQPNPFIKIEWENAYKNGITGEGAVVAVLDTGCNITHEDLRENIIGGYNSTDGSQNVVDTHGHGTHVSGTVLARDNTVGNVGVAPDAKLYIVKVFTKLDNGKEVAYTSDVVKGLNNCIARGDINVVNMSLGGGGYDGAFKSAMERCMDNGILCVVAAGNEGTDEPHYPAAFGVGLSVAASMNSGLTDFSNYGVNANIVAPGAGIYSTYRGGDDRYAKMSGTSMASPHVAGVAALIYGQMDIPKTREGAEKVKNLILDNANDIVYTYGDHSVKGGVDVQNIFHSPYVRTPDKPEPVIEKQDDTGQVIITFTGDVIYTLDGSQPTVYNGKTYTEPIRLDKPGTYKLRAIAIKKRCYSKTYKKKIEVSDNVIPQSLIESVELSCKKKIAAGKSATVEISTSGKNIPAYKFKWKSNKTGIATVDGNGNVTVSKSAKSGEKFTIKATLGDVTKKIKIKVK